MRLPHDHLITQRIKAPVMRSLNGIELLNLIGENGPISRASLAKLSRLSKPTVSSQVETLVRQGWVIEVGPGESGERGGKKPMMVRFNADAGRLFAAEIHSSRIAVAVADLEGIVRERVEYPIESDRRVDAVMSTLIAALRDLIDREPSSTGPRVISVAAPGRVDVRHGTILQAGNLFNWSEFPLRAKLEKALGVPVFVDNDVNMATLGEIHFGVARGLKDVVLLRLDTGIGSGIVIRGKLLHGAHWAAGEIAHIIVDQSGASDSWLARGYLESKVGADRIISMLHSPHSTDQQSAHDLLRQARDGNAAVRAVFDDVVLHVGITVANLICAYDPSLIVLQGKLFGVILDEIRAVVARAVPWETRITLSDITDDAVLWGAVAAARTQAYERIARLIEEQSAPEYATGARN